MRANTIRIVIAVLFVALIDSISLAEQKAPRGYTYDKTPIELSVSGHKFYVPQNDLFQYVHGQVEQKDFSLYLIAPSLNGISEQNSKCFTNRMVCDKIVFIVISNLVLPPVSEQAQGLFRDDHARTSSGPYGLMRYEQPASANVRDVYGKRLTEDEFYWISCSKQASPWDDCTYDQNLESGVSLRYVFRRTQLEHWEEIHKRITDLLASFQKEPLP